MSANTLLLIYTALPDHASASKLARALVEQRVVACAQVSAPVTSIYRWEGKIMEEPEVMLILKAQQENYPAIEAFLLAEHPYQIAEIIATPVVKASAPYYNWVLQECQVSKKK
ncbi:MAG: divalent-cation tolerance protein CutA [Candidatus Oxydemutatoraceae bacterium WSBS_2016_MAG_OTU14]